MYWDGKSAGLGAGTSSAAVTAGRTAGESIHVPRAEMLQHLTPLSCMFFSKLLVPDKIHVWGGGQCQSSSRKAAVGHEFALRLGGLILLLWKPKWMKGQEDRGGRSHQSLLSVQKKERDFHVLWRLFSYFGNSFLFMCLCKCFIAQVL